jgi:hypothetical protein
MASLRGAAEQAQPPGDRGRRHEAAALIDPQL